MFGVTFQGKWSEMLLGEGPDFCHKLEMGHLPHLACLLPPEQGPGFYII